MKNCDIDLTKDILPIQARDAIIQCFFEAHEEVLEDLGNYDEISKKELEMLIKAFNKVWNNISELENYKKT